MNGSWRLDAVCGKFRATERRDPALDRIVDRMWGLEDGEDASADRDLRAAAVRVCAVCPVRLRCAATSIVEEEQHGIFGGLNRHARLSLARFAEGQGVRCRDPKTGSRAARIDRLAAWLALHPDALDYARAVVVARHHHKVPPSLPDSFASSDICPEEPATLF